METLKQTWEAITGSIGETLPTLMGGMLILLIGWLIAVIARAGMRKLLSTVGLNAKLRVDDEVGLDFENMISKIVFWLVLIVALVAFFSILNLSAISSPLQGMLTKILEFLPNLIAGIVITLLAWGVATAIRVLIGKGLAATTLDEKVSTAADMQPMSHSLGQVAYWLVLLLFLPVILGVLKLDGLLTPVSSMVDEILAMAPNVFAALILGAAGWFVARILRDLVINLLLTMGIDQIGTRAGFSDSVKLSKLSGTVVFVFVFVPSLIAALNALKIDAISRPATDMLSSLLSAIPDLFAAVLILGIAIVVARFVANILESLLAGAGADDLPARMGLTQLDDSGFRISILVGKLASLFLILFATAEASDQLGFDQVSEQIAMLIQFGGSVLLGSIILSVGFWLAGVAHKAIIAVSGENARSMATVARFAILLLVTAMGLRAMGIADDIVNTAFTLILGAVAVAFALSFGLGGREAAGRQMEHWLSKWRSEK